MDMRIKNIDDLKIAYGKAKVRYKNLLPKYREIYQKYYPEEYAKLKEMNEKNELPQYTYAERQTSAKSYRIFPEEFPGKEHYADLPANFYDPINLRCGDPDFVDKFNYYNWDKCGDRKLPQFNLDEATSDFLGSFASLVEFLHDFEWVTNDCKAYRFGDFDKPVEYSVSDELPRYLDSRTVTYSHEDIIITDPCYVMRHDEEADDDWSKCEYGSEMTVLGSFTDDKYATADTLYGDWGCTTWNSDTKEEIGSFCADAGLVSVFSLKQVLAYNPAFDYHINRKFTTTLIEDFSGEVVLGVKFCEENCELYRYVEGRGSVNFYGGQTEL